MNPPFDQALERSTLSTRLRFVALTVGAFFVGQALSRLGAFPLVYWLVTLPGTFFHESAHFLAALLLNGQPSGFSVFPTWESGRVATLGHVLSVPNWYNAATVGLAPLFLFPLALLFVWSAAKSTRWKRTFAWLYLGVCAWASCIPSPQDVSIALAAPTSWPLAFFFFATFLWGGVLILKRNAQRR